MVSAALTRLHGQSASGNGAPPEMVPRVSLHVVFCAAMCAEFVSDAAPEIGTCMLAMAASCAVLFPSGSQYQAGVASLLPERHR